VGIFPSVESAFRTVDFLVGEDVGDASDDDLVGEEGSCEFWTREV